MGGQTCDAWSPRSAWRGSSCLLSRVTKTLAAWQRCCAEILPVWWILRKFSPKFTLFCSKIPSKCHAVLIEKFQKKYSVLLKTFHKNCCHLVGNFHKKFPSWLIFTKNAFMANFHINFAFMENYHKTLLGSKISTKIGFVGKFPQKVALLEHFHKSLFSWKISSKNPCWKSFINSLFCWKISTKNC